MNRITSFWVIAALIASSPTSGNKIYEVKEGDTLVSILRDHGYTGGYPQHESVIKDVVTLNHRRFSQASVDLIYPGENLIIPFTEPQAAIEVIDEPIVEIKPEPEPDYVGKANLINNRVTVNRFGTNNVMENNIGVLVSDRFATNNSGGLKISLEDESTYIIGANSIFAIEDFEYQPSITDRFLAKLNLIAGALSVKTGRIGKKDSDLYVLKTATTTLGVRGTEYTVRHCEVNCGDLLGTSAAVKQGTIYVPGPKGPTYVNAGQFVQVESKGATPTVGDIPEGFFDLDTNPTDIKKSWWQKSIEYIKQAIQ